MAKAEDLMEFDKAPLQPMALGVMIDMAQAQREYHL